MSYASDGQALSNINEITKLKFIIDNNIKKTPITIENDILVKFSNKQTNLD